MILLLQNGTGGNASPFQWAVNRSVATPSVEILIQVSAKIGKGNRRPGSPNNTKIDSQVQCKTRQIYIGTMSLRTSSSVEVLVPDRGPSLVSGEIYQMQDHGTQSLIETINYPYKHVILMCLKLRAV